MVEPKREDILGKEEIVPVRKADTRLFRGEGNWGDLRQQWVLGKKKQVGEGLYVYEDYTIDEFTQKYSCSEFPFSESKLRSIVRKHNWREQRKLYLEKLNEESVGQELGVYTQVNYESEVQVYGTCKKLGDILNKYMEYKFHDILEADSLIDNPNISDETIEALNNVNRNTGVPLFLTELKEALKVSEGVYNLQRKIVDNNKVDKETYRNIQKTDTNLLSASDRAKKLKQLENRLGTIFTTEDNTEVTIVDV